MLLLISLFGCNSYCRPTLVIEDNNVIISAQSRTIRERPAGYVAVEPYYEAYLETLDCIIGQIVLVAKGRESCSDCNKQQLFPNEYLDYLFAKGEIETWEKTLPNKKLLLTAKFSVDIIDSLVYIFNSSNKK